MNFPTSSSHFSRPPLASNRRDAHDVAGLPASRVLPPARWLYHGLLPLAESERGCDDPVTMDILRILHQIPECRGQHLRSRNCRCREGYQVARDDGPPPQNAAPRRQPARQPAGEVIPFEFRRGRLLDDMLQDCTRTQRAEGPIDGVEMLPGSVVDGGNGERAGLSGYVGYRCVAYRGVLSLK